MTNFYSIEVGDVIVARESYGALIKGQKYVVRWKDSHGIWVDIGWRLRGAYLPMRFIILNQCSHEREFSNGDLFFYMQCEHCGRCRDPYLNKHIERRLGMPSPSELARQEEEALEDFLGFTPQDAKAVIADSKARMATAALKVQDDKELAGSYLAKDLPIYQPLFAGNAGNFKDTNPKDAVGIKKIPFSTISAPVLAEVGVAMMEGSRKYGRHNYRVSKVRTSVYYDAALRHLTDFWEGTDIDPESGLSHITKAIAGLFVLRDAMIQGKLVDDRPPASPKEWQQKLQPVINDIFERHPNPVPAYTNEDVNGKQT